MGINPFKKKNKTWTSSDPGAVPPASNYAGPDGKKIIWDTTTSGPEGVVERDNANHITTTHQNNGVVIAQKDGHSAYRISGGEHLASGGTPAVASSSEAVQTPNYQTPSVAAAHEKFQNSALMQDIYPVADKAAPSPAAPAIPDSKLAGTMFPQAPAAAATATPAWHANPNWNTDNLEANAAAAGLTASTNKGPYAVEQRPDAAVGNSTIFRMSDGTYKTSSPKTGVSDSGTWDSSQWNNSSYAAATGKSVPVSSAPTNSPITATEVHKLPGHIGGPAVIDETDSFPAGIVTPAPSQPASASPTTHFDSEAALRAAREARLQAATPDDVPTGIVTPAPSQPASASPTTHFDSEAALRAAREARLQAATPNDVPTGIVTAAPSTPSSAYNYKPVNINALRDKRLQASMPDDLPSSMVTLPPVTLSDSPPTGIGSFSPAAGTSPHIPKHFADY